MAHTSSVSPTCSSHLPLSSSSEASVPAVDEKESTTSICSRTSRGNYSLRQNQILVKVSHVNEAFLQINTSVYDDDGMEECHFVRIVRVGPETKNESTVPGALAVVQRRRGIHLEDLSEEHGEKYYLLLETDIKTYIDL